MSRSWHMEFRRRPATAAFMLRALYPDALRRAGAFPPLHAVWSGHRAGGRPLAELLRITTTEPTDALPLLYPHVIGFPLQMVVLTHPAMPVSIWRVLQIRNHVVQHRAIAVGATVDFTTTVAGQRTLEKGAEVDLHTTVREGAEVVWESVNTFYYRGRFGPAGAPSRFAAAPQPADEVIARWSPPSSEGWRFGRLCGDLNGIHYWDAYARALGFRRALHHPQVILGQCLAHLPAAGQRGAQSLDAWLKGPVYKGADVSLAVGEDEGATSFAVFADHRRPAIVARWRALPERGRSPAEVDHP